MIVYLDTSSLVKLYVEEEGETDVAAIVKNARVAATSMIAYAEARAAFARGFREGSFTKRAYKTLLLSFEKDWINCLQVKVSQDLIRRAGDLAEKHGLRGFDAIHLSSAISLMKSNVPVVSCVTTISCRRLPCEKSLANQAHDWPFKSLGDHENRQ